MTVNEWRALAKAVADVRKRVDCGESYDNWEGCCVNGGDPMQVVDLVAQAIEEALWRKMSRPNGSTVFGLEYTQCTS